VKNPVRAVKVVAKRLVEVALVITPLVAVRLVADIPVVDALTSTVCPDTLSCEMVVEASVEVPVTKRLPDTDRLVVEALASVD
jgi:hypothetical protein